MKKKIIAIVLVAITIICAVGGYLYYKSYNSNINIDLTMSTIINKMDGNITDYKEKDGYSAYTYYLKISNNSEYDIYKIIIDDVPKNEQYELNQYYLDSFDPIYVKSGNCSVIALSMYVNDSLSETEKRNIIYSLPNAVTLCLVNPDEGEKIEYSKCVNFHYELTNDDYSKEEIQHPIVI